MPGTNLTRDEARLRASLLSVDSYTVDLDLTTGDKLFRSTTEIRFGCSRPGESTFADLVGAIVETITLNGRDLDPASVYRDSRIRLDDLAASNVLRVVAECSYSHTGEGLHRFRDPADGRLYIYSQFEVPDARRVYTTFEQPDLKARFSFNVTAPASWTVVSNAPTPEPEPVEADGGEAQAAIWRFPETAPISTYITAIIAGEYHRVDDGYAGRGGEIPLGLYCRQSMAEHLDVAELIEVTKQGFAFFEDAFDYAYPFGKYDQVFVPEYNMGAMENAGCVTFRDDYLPRSRQTRSFYEHRANTVLHEMAHMWFGDLVTMRWWDDLWLNESFAEWAAHHALVQATKYDEAWTGFTNARKNWAYRQDQLPSTHPIAADNVDLTAVEVNFDGITYAKGASALKQLVAWVGETAFLDGIRSYFRKHEFANCELADLLEALEESSGRDLRAWAREWLQTAGVNTLRPDFQVDGEGRFSAFHVAQSAHPDFPALRRHRIAVGLYDRHGRRLTRRTGVETDVAGELSEVAEVVGQRQPDLVLLNDGDLSYAKVRLDERSLASLVDGIDMLEDSLARAICWGAAWDMTRDAEMSTADFVALVLRGVGTETDMTAVGALLRYAQQAVDGYSAPATRAATKRTWEYGLRGLLEEAPSGSDHQLALTRGFSAAALSDDALDLVRGLYDGSAPLPGLTVDTDLRWSLLRCLARAGRAGREEVQAELERDDTISGREHAAGVLAVIPTPQAKEEAWHDAVVRDDVPNETQRSIAFSFQVAGQEEVLAPYVDRYLDVASTIWEDKGVQRASTALVALFPRAIPTSGTLNAVDRWLAGSEANPAAKRYVREGRADIERALAAQAKDAAASAEDTARTVRAG